MKAKLNNYRGSPRKVRLVADLVRGKSVGQALLVLQTLTKRAALPVRKVIKSAVDNAKANYTKDEADLRIKSITVDGGVTLHRIMPRARGAAFPLRKRTSKISVHLEDEPAKQTQAAASVGDGVVKSQ